MVLVLKRFSSGVFEEYSREYGKKYSEESLRKAYSIENRGDKKAIEIQVTSKVAFPPRCFGLFLLSFLFFSFWNHERALPSHGSVIIFL